MIRPFTFDLHANRWTPFAQTLVVEGVDLSGSTLRAQVRLTGDATGSPLVDLNMEDPGVEGISVSVDSSGTSPVSAITMLIDDLSAMPTAKEIGDAATFAWDFQVHRPGYVNAVWWRGDFIVEAGVAR